MVYLMRRAVVTIGYRRVQILINRNRRGILINCRGKARVLTRPDNLTIAALANTAA